jgi:hypothetical protein
MSSVAVLAVVLKPVLSVLWDRDSPRWVAFYSFVRCQAVSLAQPRLQKNPASFYHRSAMPFPIRVCAVCGEEFELKPDKPGFANRCPSCSEPEEADTPDSRLSSGDTELNAARRNAMRDMLYRKES